MKTEKNIKVITLIIGKVFSLFLEITFSAVLGGMIALFFCFVPIHVFSFNLAGIVFLCAWLIATLVLFIQFRISDKKTEGKSQNDCDHFSAVRIRPAGVAGSDLMRCPTCKKIFYRKSMDHSAT